MGLELDGVAVLRSIATHPRAFPNIEAGARKAARALVIAQLKAKTADVEMLREIRLALGNEFSLLADGMSDAEVKSLLSKFDRHHPELKGAQEEWRRRHLMALAEGRVEPALKPKTRKTKTEKPKKPPTEPTPERLSSTAMATVRKRGRSHS